VHQRTGANLWLCEVVATLGLVLVIFGMARAGRAASIGIAVGGYITAAYWFTSSTSFANPAVTIARMFSNTFAGISLGSVPMFIVMQLIGGLAAWLLVRALYPAARVAAEIVDEPAADSTADPSPPAPADRDSLPCPAVPLSRAGRGPSATSSATRAVTRWRI
jgi:Major intrinsic protein